VTSPRPLSRTLAELLQDPAIAAFVEAVRRGEAREGEGAEWHARYVAERETS
jgi:hypothetical protein